MAETLDPIDDGIWRWTARHPEWHPSGFGDEVACFAVKTDAELLLSDPLLPADPAPIDELVDAHGGEEDDDGRDPNVEAPAPWAAPVLGNVTDRAERRPID